MAFKIARIVSILMLFIAIDKQPKPYYAAMRLVLVSTALLGAYRAKIHKSTPWLVVFGSMALLYNPVYRLRLGRDNWVPMDMIVAMVFILSFFLVREGKPMHTHVAPPSESV